MQNIERTIISKQFIFFFESDYPKKSYAKNTLKILLKKILYSKKNIKIISKKNENSIKDENNIKKKKKNS